MNNSRTHELDITGNLEIIRRIKEIGRDEDLNNGGLCDVRSGCINFWCSPDDKPECWPDKIEQGCLDYPRAYVGGLYWTWEGDNLAKFYVDITPFEMVDPNRNGRIKNLTDEQWDALISWVEEKALELINRANNILSSQKC